MVIRPVYLFFSILLGVLLITLCVAFGFAIYHLVLDIGLLLTVAGLASFAAVVAVVYRLLIRHYS